MCNGKSQYGGPGRREEFLFYGPRALAPRPTQAEPPTPDARSRAGDIALRLRSDFEPGRSRAALPNDVHPANGLLRAVTVRGVQRNGTAAAASAVHAGVQTQNQERPVIS